MSAQQIAQYNDNRLGMVVINHGESNVYMSADKTDLERSQPFGIALEPGIPLAMPWIQWGEIIWLEWWVECTRYRISVYEWWCSPQIDKWTLTPFKTKCDRKIIVEPEPPLPPVNRCDKFKSSFCPRLKDMINRLKSERNGNG